MNRVWQAIEAGDEISLGRALAEGKGRAQAREKKDGETPLAHALKKNLRDGIFDLLLKASDPNVRESGGGNALHIAVEFAGADRVAKIMALTEAGARDAEGNTALMLAARHRDSAALMELLLPTSDPKAVNAHGETALMLAVVNGCGHSARILAPVSDCDARDNDGCAPIHAAARLDMLTVMVERNIKKLESGEDFEDPATMMLNILMPFSANPRTSDGKSAFELAVAESNYEAADCMSTVASREGLEWAFRAAHAKNGGGAVPAVMPMAAALLEAQRIKDAISAPAQGSVSEGKDTAKTQTRFKNRAL